MYVYDNNSTDQTASLAREAGALAIPEYKQGKGNVICSMCRNIDAECYLMADGDDTYPAEHAREKDYRPFAFFTLITILLFLLGTGFLIPILIECAKTGEVPKIPTLVVCGFSLHTGLLSFICGLILSTLSKMRRQLFELHLINIQPQKPKNK